MKPLNKSLASPSRYPPPIWLHPRLPIPTRHRNLMGYNRTDVNTRGTPREILLLKLY